MASNKSMSRLMQGVARVPARFDLFMELRQLIHTGRVGDSPLALEQQLDDAFESIVAKYSDQPTFQSYFTYFRKNYMHRKSTPTATSSAPEFVLLLSCPLGEF